MTHELNTWGRERERGCGRCFCNLLQRDAQRRVSRATRVLKATRRPRLRRGGRIEARRCCRRRRRRRPPTYVTDLLSSRRENSGSHRDPWNLEKVPGQPLLDVTLRKRSSHRDCEIFMWAEETVCVISRKLYSQIPSVDSQEKTLL